MKSVLQILKDKPCRDYEITETERVAFSNYKFLQRYNPAIDLFNIPDSLPKIINKYFEYDIFRNISKIA